MHLSTLVRFIFVVFTLKSEFAIGLNNYNNNNNIEDELSRENLGVSGTF
jgi:hypothetical protein